jgi:hypothetical protein
MLTPMIKYPASSEGISRAGRVSMARLPAPPARRPGSDHTPLGDVRPLGGLAPTGVFDDFCCSSIFLWRSSLTVMFPSSSRFKISVCGVWSPPCGVIPLACQACDAEYQLRTLELHAVTNIWGKRVFARRADTLTCVVDHRREVAQPCMRRVMAAPLHRIVSADKAWAQPPIPQGVCFQTRGAHALTCLRAYVLTCFGMSDTQYCIFIQYYTPKWPRAAPIRAVASMHVFAGKLIQYRKWERS